MKQVNEKQVVSNGLFSSKVGFILASVGSAVGMGNIWLFPYRVGQYGGAAFLIPYFLFVAIFGYVGLSGEFALGRLTGTGPIGSYDYALKTRNKKGGSILGTFPLLGSFGIAVGYAIILGWVLRTLWGSVSGSLFSQESEEFFAQMTGKFGSVPWHLVVILITVLFLAFGAVKSIEKVNKFMMPAFFILFIIIAVCVARLPGAWEGYQYLLLPKWEALLNPETWVMAMGQAFFSLSITGSGMIIYGSYLNKKEDILHSAGTTAILGTCAALLAGFAIIPAVFAFGIDPQSGPPLMFITLPKVFAQMGFGRMIAVLFFLSVLFAGLTSLMNMFEVCSEAVQQKLKLKRTHAVFLVGILAFLIGLFVEYEPYMGSWMDTVTIYIVPIGALLGAIMIFWVLGTKRLNQEINSSAKHPVGKFFNFIGKYVYIILAFSVIVLGIVYGGIG